MLKIKNLVTGVAIAVTTASVLSVSSASANSFPVSNQSLLGRNFSAASNVFTPSSNDSDFSKIDVSDGNSVYANLGMTVGTQKYTFHGTSGKRVAGYFKVPYRVRVIAPSGKVVFDKTNPQSASLEVAQIMTLPETGVYMVQYDSASDDSAGGELTLGLYPILEYGQSMTHDANDLRLNANSSASNMNYAIDTSQSSYALNLMLNDTRSDKTQPLDDYTANNDVKLDISRYYAKDQNNRNGISGVEERTSEPMSQLRVGHEKTLHVQNNTGGLFDVISTHRDDTDIDKYPMSITSQTSKYYVKSGDMIKDDLPFMDFFDRIKSFFADPVDSGTGAFVDNRTVLAYGGPNPLKFDLSYNSIANDHTQFKGGYDSNFNQKLIDNSDSVVVYFSGNSAVKFDKSGSSYISYDARLATMHLSKTSDGYQLTDDSGETYIFDTHGLILKHIEKTGNVISYSYDDNRLMKVSNSSNQWFAYKYNDDGSIHSISDKANREVLFDFDYNGLLDDVASDDKHFRINYADNQKIASLQYDGTTLVSNEFDSYGRVVKQTDAKNVVSTFSYDNHDSGAVTTTINNSKSDTVVNHDAVGNLISVKDGNGHITSYAYDAKNNQISETDGVGNTTKREYNDKSQMVKQISPMGKTTLFDYDATSNLTKVTTPDSKSASMTYENHRLVQSVAKNGVVSKMSYDTIGRPLSVTKGNQTYDYTYDATGSVDTLRVNGVVTKFNNDELGRATQTTLTDGSKVETEYDFRGNVTKTTKPDGSFVSMTYDGFGNVLTSTDENGHETDNSYDDSGNLSSSTQGNFKVGYSYDDLNQRTKVTVGDDTKSTFDYDNVGNVVKTTDASGNSVATSYDNANRVVSETKGKQSVSKVYNADSQVISETDGNHGVTKFEYDDSGNTVAITSPNNQKTILTYDVAGNVLTKSVSGKTETYSYDLNNNRVSATDANNNTTKYDYDVNNRLVKTTNALGQISTNSYNALGQLFETKNDSGALVYQYSYNVNGLLNKIVDGNGNATTMTYDKSGQILSIQDSYGQVVDTKSYTDLSQIATQVNALNAKTSFDYNDSLTKVTTTNPLNQTKTVTSSLDGNLTGASDNSTSGMVDYNADGLKSSQSLSGGLNETSYDYDNNGNVTTESNNDSHVTYQYNADNQMTGWTNARGQQTSYTLDDSGQVVKASASDLNANYQYDNNGNELEAKNDNRDVTKIYDALNRVTSVSSGGKTIKYGYDNLGNLILLIYPDGKSVTYKYDVMHRMTSVTDWAGHVTSYSYDKNNRIVSTNYFNGIVESRSYDKAGQLTDIKTSRNGTVLDSHHYVYDAGGNLIKGDTSYTYDSSNRLLKGLGTYKYDVSGNITSGNNHNFNYDSDSRFTKIDGKATASDKDGNLTNYTLNGASHTAGYNSQNQLTDFDATHYDYDADGNRLYHGSVYASGKLLQDDDYLYVYGANGLVSFSTGDKFYTNAYNNRGDAVKTFDNTGVSGTIKYSDYGAVTSQTGIVSTFKYAGQHGAITDSNGLVYLQTRYYNPQLMRFMNRDTVSGSITDTQSLNRFSYVEGNPLTYVDLNGQARTWLKNNGSNLFLYTELTLAGIGMIPIASDFTNAILMVMDLAVGDYPGVALDSVGLIPFADDASNAVKVGRIAEKLDKSASTAEKFNVTEKLTKSEMPRIGTKIDDSVRVSQQQTELPSQLSSTFKDSNYVTVKTTNPVKLYRAFGDKALISGSFATTTKAGNRINAKISSALKPEWKNSITHEAEITVPTGTELQIGKVAPQEIESSKTVLSGGGDQILLPRGWYESHPDWVNEIHEVKSR